MFVAFRLLYCFGVSRFWGDGFWGFGGLRGSRVVRAFLGGVLGLGRLGSRPLEATKVDVGGFRVEG